MNNALIYIFPDIREIIINYREELPLEECFEKMKIFCEKYKGKLKTAQILLYKNKKLILKIEGIEPHYKLDKNYEYLKPVILEIFQKFLDDPSIIGVKPPTVEELRNFDVILEAYTEPSEFYYGADFQEKCKFSEVLNIMKKMAEDYATQFPKLTFDVDTIDNKHLFSIYHKNLEDLSNIHLGRINELNVNKDLIKEVLVLEQEALSKL